MASTSTVATTVAAIGAPYELDTSQTVKASRALLKHIKSSNQAKAQQSMKKSLLDAEDDSHDTVQTPIWLTLTTKKHIIDKKRLKPAKIALPHPLMTSTSSNICLITADPQRTYKDIVASPAFPSELAACITRVIGVTKLKAKYSEYEAQRKLCSEHDLFLADDRIITRLSSILGKTFYKTAMKRPIPISMQAAAPRSDGKKIAKAVRGVSAKDIITPKKLAAEVEKVFGSAVVALSPSTMTSVRVGTTRFTAEQLAENVQVVVTELVSKFVPQKWKGVRGIHIKGPETAAMPIWLADQLWVEEKDVLAEVSETKAIAGAESPNVGKKRKAIEENVDEIKGKRTKVAKGKMVESNDSNLDTEIALRKEKLKKQKEEAASSVEDGVILPSKSNRIKKSKSVVA